MPALSTLTVHGDDDVNKIPSCLRQEVTDVAPAMHVSTTFRYSRNPDELVEAKDVDVSPACSCPSPPVRMNADGRIARDAGDACLFQGDGTEYDEARGYPQQDHQWESLDLQLGPQRNLCRIRQSKPLSLPVT